MSLPDTIKHHITSHKNIKWRKNGKRGGLWSGISGAKRHSPGNTQYTPWSQDLFTHKPSQLPGEHTARLLFPAAELLKLTNLRCNARYLLVSPISLHADQFLTMPTIADLMVYA